MKEQQVRTAANRIEEIADQCQDALEIMKSELLKFQTDPNPMEIKKEDFMESMEISIVQLSSKMERIKQCVKGFIDADWKNN